MSRLEEAPRPIRLAILGTRGIPNRYGGFEQFAEVLSAALAARGWDVTVFNPDGHEYGLPKLGAVSIERVPAPRGLGALATVIFDLRSLRRAARMRFDVVLQLGSQWALVRPLVAGRLPPVVTNMDGLEWRRDKWSPPVKLLFLALERAACRLSSGLIADSRAIQAYLWARYRAAASFVPYPAAIVPRTDPRLIERYGLAPFAYDLVVSRLTPENSIEPILRAYRRTQDGPPLVVVGGVDAEFGRRVARLYADGRIRFVGSIYDKATLDALRMHARLYVHGHTVGGTNPSLLEAMAASAQVVAHDNVFNREVLGESGLYFRDEDELASVLARPSAWSSRRAEQLAAQRDALLGAYTLEAVVDGYERVLRAAAGRPVDANAEAQEERRPHLRGAG